jgi:hypothetical protein
MKKINSNIGTEGIISDQWSNLFSYFELLHKINLRLEKNKSQNSKAIAERLAPSPNGENA